MSHLPQQIQAPDIKSHTARGVVLLAMLQANALTDRTMPREKMHIFRGQSFREWPKEMQDQLRPFGAEVIGNVNVPVAASGISACVLWPSDISAEQEEAILCEFNAGALGILQGLHYISRYKASLKPFIERCTNVYDLAMLSIYGGWKHGPKIAPESFCLYRPAVRLRDGNIAWHPLARTQGEALLCWLEDQNVSVADFDIDDLYGTGGIGPDGYYYEAPRIGNAPVEFQVMREARMRPLKAIYPPDQINRIPLTFKGECEQLEFPFFPKFSLLDNELGPIDKLRAIVLLALLYKGKLTDHFIAPEEMWDFRFREYPEWPPELQVKLWPFGAEAINTPKAPPG